jgi:hypothetical protein
MFVLMFHWDTCEPYESYPSSTPMAIFSEKPKSVELLEILRKHLPNQAGLVRLASSMGAGVFVDDGSYYGCCLTISIVEVEVVR